jgi:hypothetical protein
MIAAMFFDPGDFTDRLRTDPTMKAIEVPDLHPTAHEPRKLLISL